MFDGVVNLLSILVDENCEHFLRVGLLTILGLGLSVYHNLLSSHSLRRLHHLGLWHGAHRIVQLLHVAITSDKHLLSNHLLLLSLIGETLCIEELIWNARLASILIHHVGVNEYWSALHEHCLLVILSRRIELRLSCVLVVTLSRHNVLLHLTSVHHGRCHHGLLLRIHHLRHGHLLGTLVVKLVRHSHLKFVSAVCEGALVAVRTIPSALKELAFDCLVVVVLLLKSALVLVHSEASSSSNEASTRVEESATTSSWHLLRHATRIMKVVESTVEVSTATSSVVLVAPARHSSILSKASASSEVPLLEAAIALWSRIVGPWVYWHTSHSRCFHMLRNWLRIK